MFCPTYSKVGGFCKPISRVISWRLNVLGGTFYEHLGDTTFLFCPPLMDFTSERASFLRLVSNQVTSSRSGVLEILYLVLSGGR